MLLLGLLFPFNGFEIEILNHVMIAPSHLNPVSWDNIRVFQYLCEYLGGKLYLSLLFHLFIIQCFLVKNAQRYSLITLAHVRRYFEVLSNGVKHLEDRLLFYPS